MDARSAICLVIDRLSAAYVGPMGNSWIRTPAFDRLAAQSIVFDRAMTDSPAIDAVYESYWSGTEAWRAVDWPQVADSEQSLPGICRVRGMPTVLVTDDDTVAAHRLAREFDEVVHLPQSARRGPGDNETRRQPTPLGDWQETQLAAYFAAAVEILQSRRPPALVWLHVGAMGRVWDSPQALRDQYAVEDDPAATLLNEPPSLELDAQTDPDVLLGMRHAYAGEVSVLDHCLSMLLDTLSAGDWRSALLVVTSCRGYPLGEHGIVGDARAALYGELVRTPLFIRGPSGPRYGAHCQSLAQPADLHATLLEWLTADGTAEEPVIERSYTGCSLFSGERPSDSGRTLAISRSKRDEIALATPAWFVRAGAVGQKLDPAGEAQTDQGTATERQIELFSQPDDYFQVNEVSDRCREIVEEFAEAVRAIEHASMKGSSLEFTLSEAALGVR